MVEINAGKALADAPCNPTCVQSPEQLTVTMLDFEGQAKHLARADVEGKGIASLQVTLKCGPALSWAS